MTPGTLALLHRLLTSQQLSVGADDFAETALAVILALRELDEAITEAATTQAPETVTGNATCRP